MTPAARAQAAIDIIDAIRAGAPAEQALTRWARASRFAGSKDRAAVRDLVFDVRRQWRSTAALGGGESGRARMLGLCRAQGLDPDTLFSGQGHGPAPLSDGERQGGAAAEGGAALDIPDWLWPVFEEGRDSDTARANVLGLRARAPVDLRVNLLKTDRASAQMRLASEGIVAHPVPLAETALRVTAGGRGVNRCAAFEDGWIDLQDAASQAVVATLPLVPGMRVLDYCAGGGGKALAMAALTRGPVDAHDAAPQRMATLPTRARRAGASVSCIAQPQGGYDLILCDVPCSGSGAWRRAPDGKWRLTSDALEATRDVQREILREAARLVRPGGVLAYATCSVFATENEVQVSTFLQSNPGFSLRRSRQYHLGDGGDGFFVAVLDKRDK